MRQTILNRAIEQLQANRDKNKQRVEWLVANLRQNKTFNELYSTMLSLDIDIVNSEICGDKEKTASLTQEQAQCEEQLQKFLAQGKLTIADLTAEHNCPKCEDSGYVNGKMCSCLKQAITMLVKKGNDTLPPHNFSHNTDSDPHNNAVLAKCKAIADGKANTNNVLLLGATGTGKTFLLACIANQLIDNGVDVMYLSAYNLNQQLLDCHLGGNAMKKQLLDMLCSCDTLVIDDLGTENTYRNVTIEYLNSIISERTQNNLPIMISTNLTPAKLRDQYGDRIFSRITNKQTTFIAQLVGNDKRTKA